MISSLRRLKNGVAVDFANNMFVVSSAIHNGGVGFRDGFFVVYVDKNYRGNAYADIEKFAEMNDLHNYSGFMTAATETHSTRCGDVEVYANVGITNLCVPGDECSYERGTVNLFVILNTNLSLAGLVNALSTAIESKAYTLTRLTGKPSTTSDAVLVASHLGHNDFAGSATEIGRSIGLCVRRLIENALSH